MHPVIERLVEDIRLKFDASEANSILKIIELDLFEHKFLLTDFFESYTLSLIIDALNKVIQGIPVQYIVKKSWFYGYPFFVNPDVLIPRHETEELVHLVIQEAKKKFINPVIVDLCTGSGCIAVVLKKKLPQSSIWALDVEKKALDVATFNAKNLQVEVNFILHDLFKSWKPEIMYDIVVCNPPYISDLELPHVSESTYKNEPHKALFTGEKTGLVFYERVLDMSKNLLSPGGFIAFECSAFTAEDVVKLAQDKGYADIHLLKDIQSMPRMVLIQNILNYY